MKKEPTREEFIAQRAEHMKPENGINWDADDIVSVMMTTQRSLAFSGTEAFLFDCTGWYIGEERPHIPVSVDQVKVAAGKWQIAPLSQFGFANKSGWRLLFGDIGEKYDIYCLVQ